MISNRIKLLVVCIMVLGVTTQAYACGDEAKDKSTSASFSSTEKAGADCCASKSAKMAKAGMSKECSAKMSSASVASAAGEHCTAGMKAAAGSCSYGENSVTMTGAPASKNEIDYAFYVSGAECKGTGTSVAHTVRALKGVAAVTVDYDKHMVYVCADGKAASKQSIEKSLKGAGYDDVKFVNASKQNCSKSHGKIEA